MGQLPFTTSNRNPFSYLLVFEFARDLLARLAEGVHQHAEQATILQSRKFAHVRVHE